MILSVAVMIGVGVACCMIVGSWLAGDAPKPSLDQQAAASTDRITTVAGAACAEIGSLRAEVDSLRTQLSAALFERNTWRERAAVAIRVCGDTQRQIYAPRCECAECRHVRGCT